jgi:hypothetical protein
MKRVATLEWGSCLRHNKSDMLQHTLLVRTSRADSLLGTLRLPSGPFVLVLIVQVSALHLLPSLPMHL